jgi:bacteriocin-like protein
LEITMARDNKHPSKPKHPTPVEQCELTDEQLNQVTGGVVKFEYRQVTTRYLPQKTEDQPSDN